MATQQQMALLKQGSKGNDVSAIQQALKGYGFYGGVVDGLFGPKTAQAVKDFQNQTGIKVDAIVGPQTRGQLDSWAQNPHNVVQNDPLVQQLAQNDPIVARTLQATANGGNQANLLAAAHALSSKGYYFGPDTWISAENMKPFFEAAKKELDPAFNQSLDYYKSDFLSGIEKEKADYEDALKNQQEKIFNEKLKLDQGQAQTNNIDSSLGAKQRTMFTDSSNRDISGLERNTTYKLSDLARNYENKLGTNDVNQFNFGITSPGQVNSIGKYQSGNGTRNGYSPIGGQQGTLRNAYAAQVEQYGKAKAGTEFGYPVK